MRRAALIAVLLAATLGGACNSDNDLTFFDAILSPDNEVPARASGASGVARLTFDGTTVTFIVAGRELQQLHAWATSTRAPRE